MPSQDLPVGFRLGVYRIEALLGRGGMAVVYEATDSRLGRRVALKVLTRERSESPEFRKRFLREAHFAASLDHPNIVPIYDTGAEKGLLYIAMRLVRGGNLAALLRRGGPLEPGHALAIIAPVADALDAAHATGLIHRDVKPANILLSPVAERHGYEHVYLSDFGLTRYATEMSKLTGTGNLIGTLDYIAPEQIRGQSIDARTDLYALGCVAYECLTGHAVFRRDDPAALLWAHLNDVPDAGLRGPQRSAGRGSSGGKGAGEESECAVPVVRAVRDGIGRCVAHRSSPAVRHEHRRTRHTCRHSGTGRRTVARRAERR